MQRTASSFGIVGGLAMLAALAVTSGCIVFPKTVTSEVIVGIADSPPVFSDAVVGWQITARPDARMANLVVTAAHVVECTHTRTETYDEHQTKTLDVGGPLAGGGTTSDRPRDMGMLVVAQLVVSPLTAFSAVVSGVIVLAHHDTTTRKTRAVERVSGTCARAAANLDVQLTLPSGAVLTAMSGIDGRARFAIPPAAPDRDPEAGVAIVRVAHQRRAVALYQTTAGCVRARADISSRVVAAADLNERLMLLRALPAMCGDAGAHAPAPSPKAATVSASVRQLSAACIAHRRAAMLRAQQLDDATARAEILTNLQDCTELSAPLRALPPALDRAMVASAIADLTARVTACKAASPAHGTVTVRVDVSGEGRVANIEVERAPDEILGACVTDIMQTATFAETQRGGSFKVPFVF